MFTLPNLSWSPTEQRKTPPKATSSPKHTELSSSSMAWCIVWFIVWHRFNFVVLPNRYIFISYIFNTNGVRLFIDTND